MLLLILIQSSPVSTEPSKFRIEPVSASLESRMVGVTWHKGCPVPLSNLREVHLLHKKPNGDTQEGILIVHKDVARETLQIFERLFQAGFILVEVQPAVTHAGDDDHLMATNTTTAFNCRPITGGKGWSRHSFGKAIDINPLWNPYVKGSTILPPAGTNFAKNRGRLPGPGLLLPKSLPVTLFKAAGWRWGGDWRRVKDYQHVEKR